uniref:Uncharacterized protein n=1 Tax=Tanacetum cinerariifolium TaxID=118510 RepID=A0A699REJ4_TANCI|nr:hypothetical protein [Tanacetum cinerariifolium]
MPDRRLLELEDQIKFLLKGSQSTPEPSSTQVPQAYAEAFHSNTRPRNQTVPPKQSPYTFREQERKKGVKKTNVTTGDDFEKPTKMPVKGAMKEDEAENEPNRKAKKEKTIEEPSSQPVEYYLKHKINEKLIEGLVGNHRFNDSCQEHESEK